MSFKPVCLPLVKQLCLVFCKGPDRPVHNRILLLSDSKGFNNNKSVEPIRLSNRGLWKDPCKNKLTILHTRIDMKYLPLTGHTTWPNTSVALFVNPLALKTSTFSIWDQTKTLSQYVILPRQHDKYMQYSLNIGRVWCDFIHSGVALFDFIKIKEGDLSITSDRRETLAFLRKSRDSPKAVLRCMGGDLSAVVPSASRRLRAFSCLRVGR